MRLVRFFDFRQTRFKRGVEEVLKDLSERLDAHDEELAREKESYRELCDTLGALRSEVEASSPMRYEYGTQHGRLARLYARFHERFRGSETRSIDSYLPRIIERMAALGQRLPFLDVGCGRGAFVAALREEGVPAEGVEANPELAQQAQRAGLPVRLGDLFIALRDLADESLAGLSAIQVVEHLGIEALLELLELARKKIAPNGLLLLETIDVGTLHALRWYLADPTHRLPLMPQTLSFYVEDAGFTNLEIIHLNPAVPAGLLEADGGGELDRRTLELLFGAQDFAILASAPGTPEASRP